MIQLTTSGVLDSAICTAVAPEAVRTRRIQATARPYRRVD